MAKKDFKVGDIVTYWINPAEDKKRKAEILSIGSGRDGYVRVQFLDKTKEVVSVPLSHITEGNHMKKEDNLVDQAAKLLENQGPTGTNLPYNLFQRWSLQNVIGEAGPETADAPDGKKREKEIAADEVVAKNVSASPEAIGSRESELKKDSASSAEVVEAAEEPAPEVDGEKVAKEAGEVAEDHIDDKLEPEEFAKEACEDYEGAPEEPKKKVGDKDVLEKEEDEVEVKKESSLFTKAADESCGAEHKEEVKESIDAVGGDLSDIGRRVGPEPLKTVDVILDDGGFRLLLARASGKHDILPDVTQPACPSLDALVDFADSFIDAVANPEDAALLVAKAVERAGNLPSLLVKQSGIKGEER